MNHFKFTLGCIVGAVAGYAAGVLLAPRSGAESRAMASDVVNDAWDSAIDTYERGQQAVASKFESIRPNTEEATDELRAKVDLARERMDQLRDSLNDTPAEAGTEAAAEETAEAVEEQAGEKPVIVVADESVVEPAADEPVVEEPAFIEVPEEPVAEEAAETPVADEPAEAESAE